MADFIENSIDYSRQAGMEGLSGGSISNTCHAIIGCGGIGYWTAIFLAMMGAKALALIDGDNIESSNLPRLPVGIRHLGRMKVNTLKATLRLLRPMVRVMVVPTHIHANSLHAIMGLCNDNRMSGRGLFIWDCTDDARIQIKIANYADAIGITYRKLGYEGWNIGSYSSSHIKSMWIDDSYRPGYISNASNVLSSVVAAALGILRAFSSPTANQPDANWDDTSEINLREAVWTPTR